DRVMYLKREQHVSLFQRLGQLLTGFGPVSRSLREAELLRRVEGFAPRCLAAGEDGRGRAFVLIEAVPHAVSLPEWLRQERSAQERRQLASALGQMLAALHVRGVVHHDLYARHVLITERDGGIVLIDWQRARRARGERWQRDLATLHATLDESLATRRERLAC